MTGLTMQAAEFIAGLHFDDLPEGAAQTILDGIIDCAGVIVLGADEPVTRIVADQCGAAGRTGEARALWGRFATSAELAALVNATAAHALDYDDTGLEGHPSAVLFPAVLALGEAIGATGRDLITAYAAGYELWAEILTRDTERYHAKGFHPSGVVGTLAAAAAAARMLRLDAPRTAMVLSLAGSMASGLVANFGSMTKPYQLGRAVQNGVLAAWLVQAGLTAAPDGLEHENGFLAAFSPGGGADLTRPAAFGDRWRIREEGLNLKLYPVCYAMHRMLDSAVALCSDMAGEGDQIAAVRVHLGRNQSRMLRVRCAETTLEAKFSAEHCVAAALIAGRVGTAEIATDFIHRDDVRRLGALIERIESAETDPEQPLFSPGDRVELTLRDGRILTGPEVRYAFGHARNPAPRSALRAKFADCTAGALSPEARDSLFDRLAGLESAADLSGLAPLAPT